MTALAFPQRRRRGPSNRRGTTSTRLVSLAAVGASLLVGLGASVDPKYAIAGVAAIAFVLIVLTDIVASFGIFAGLTFLETLSSGHTASVDKLAGLVIVFAWLIRLAIEAHARERIGLRENRRLFVFLTLYLALNLISAVWATSAGAAISQSYRYTLDALLIPIVYTIVETRRDLVKIMSGYFVGAGFSTLYGLVVHNPGVADQAGRLTGSIGEANQTATILVSAMMLCAGLWTLSRRSPRLRLFIIATVVLSIIGLVGTLSRSGLIAFAVVLVLAAVVGGPARHAARWACLIVVIAAPTYFVFFAGHRAHRVDSDQSSGRNNIWLVAVREWEDHPVLGVGAGNFEVISTQYLDRPGLLSSAYLFVDDGIVVHNIYLEQLVTLGPLGLILLLGAFAALLRIGMRAIHIFERLGDDELALLSRFWILALVAFMTADFFASELVDKQLWIVAAIGPALFKLANLEASHRATQRSEPAKLGVPASA